MNTTPLSLPLKLKALCSMGLMVWVSGCGYRLAKVDPPPLPAFGPPPASAAQICVLRPRLAPSSLVFTVRDNNKLVGATRGSSYFCYLAQPGPHKISSSRLGTVEETAILVQPGARYFLYQNVDPYPDATRSWLSWTTEADARTMVGECQYRVVTGAPGGEELPGNRPMARADSALRLAAAPAPNSLVSDSAELKERVADPSTSASSPSTASDGATPQKVVDAGPTAALPTTPVSGGDTTAGKATGGAARPAKAPRGARGRGARKGRPTIIIPEGSSAD